jgi:hypothetical protein
MTTATANDSVEVTDQLSVELNGEDVPQDVEEQDEDTTEPVEGDVVDAEGDVVAEAPAKGKRGRKPKAEVVETSEFTKAKARTITDKLRKNFEQAADQLMEAYQGRIWLALNDPETGEPYKTWTDYLTGEFGEYRIKLPKPRRLELVERMTYEAKMPTRAIGDALGVDQKTVVNDRKELAEAHDAADGEREGATVVGEGGVEVPIAKARREETPEKRAAKFADRVTRVFEKLDKAAGDLTEAMTDELFEEVAGELAKRHRGDAVRLASVIAQFQESIQ